MTLLLIILVLGLLALAGVGVVGFFNSGLKNAKTENKNLRVDLQAAEQRVSLAQQALVEIAAGHSTPILRASDALSGMYSKTLTKGN